MITPFAEALKGLYDKQLIGKEIIDKFYNEKKITEEEHLYILGKEGN